MSCLNPEPVRQSFWHLTCIPHKVTCPPTKSLKGQVHRLYQASVTKLSPLPALLRHPFQLFSPECQGLLVLSSHKWLRGHKFQPGFMYLIFLFPVPVIWDICLCRVKGLPPPGTKNLFIHSQRVGSWSEFATQLSFNPVCARQQLISWHLWKNQNKLVCCLWP